MTSKHVSRIEIIDSHTGGEPTRVIVKGGPKLVGRTVAEKRDDFRDRFDAFRSAVVNEPRGSDVLVGALLTEPSDRFCVAGVIFFNNVGYLGMCGHGTIGLLVSLAHMGKIGPGAHRIDTPVGVVTATLHGPGDVSVRNVPCRRSAKGLVVDVPGCGPIRGDVAWGGNWFFLIEDHGQEIALDYAENLIDFTWRVRQALERQGVRGDDGQEIDHIELFAPSDKAGVNSKNFVLCPGKAYDRSPCGTGTSAKLACLVADGKLWPGETWRQESLIGSVFDGTVEIVNGEVIPSIRGTAFITSEASLILDPDDPFCWGIR